MFKNFQNVTVRITEDGFNIVFICYQEPAKTKEDLEEASNQIQAQYNFRYALPDLMKEIRPLRIRRDGLCAIARSLPLLAIMKDT